MARQNLPTEVNSFVGGLVTEASPLTFPPNAAIDLNNMVLSKTGALSRRLGMNFEAGHQTINSGVTHNVDGNTAYGSGVWENAGGVPDARLAVVQIGNQVAFFNTATTPLSDGFEQSFTFPSSNDSLQYQYAVVDGLLVMTSGDSVVHAFTYDVSQPVGSRITFEEYRLKVRDQFGVEFLYTAPLGASIQYTDVDLRLPENVAVRPNVGPPAVLSDHLTSEYFYNLRNGTYSPPRISGSAESLQDPISIFAAYFSSRRGGLYPAMSDSVNKALFPDPENSTDRLVDRFFPKDLDVDLTTQEMPKGYFVIDLLERGTSRLEQAQKMEDENEYDNAFNITALPTDSTPGGAKVVGEFAGRVWYGGFSGEVIDGDVYSPKLSSYIAFSKLVEFPREIGDCFQTGDPTSKAEPDLLDTDGGFIRLDGAYNITRLVNIGESLLVVAENGVWAITGGDSGFTALDYTVVKLSNHGSVAPNAVVQVDNSIMYWSDDGIYAISRNNVGDLGATNVTNTTIQQFYESIPSLDKRKAQGYFDTYERKVRWLYTVLINSEEVTVELIFDTNLSAFYKNTIQNLDVDNPKAVAYVEIPPYSLNEVVENVVYEGDPVEYNGDPVVYTDRLSTFPGVRELVYLTETGLSGSDEIEYTFSRYKDDSFKDWLTVDGEGVDAPAYIITGYEGGGDYQRNKQTPYITFHFQQTEDGFYTDNEGDIYPTNPSSCLVQAQWEWANSEQSGRWGKTFQAYRIKRAYIPASDVDSYNNGFSVVSTKNKLRGKGKVLSLYIQTEPEQNLKLLGWSSMISVGTNI